MIDAIIFSNNSPLFLETFLQSVMDNNISVFNFSVLYKSDDLNVSEYLRVFEKNNISRHIQESDFKEDLLKLMHASSNNLVAFFKDTNYFFSELPVGDIEKIMEDQDIFCFSLSLGRNIKISYANDVVNVLINETENSKNTIRWDWIKHYLDFGRPLSFDGHIFTAKDIYKLFKKWKYDNIFELESCFDLLDYYPREFMSSFNTSVLVDVIIKTVEENFQEKIKNFSFESIEKNAIEI